jgi:hypothetical protein
MFASRLNWASEAVIGDRRRGAPDRSTRAPSALDAFVWR